MNLTHLLNRPIIFAGLLLATGPLAAQTAPTQPTPAETPPESGNSEVITLSTFDVSASSAHTYTSDTTTTGTRVATNLRELPFSVNVITSDFIKDFAAFEFNDQVANVSSLSISEVQGQYQLRGIPITTQLVDGFRRLGLIDPVNIDRIEVIKGPAASVYGYIQPGGVVNITTKRPLANPQQSITLSAGDYDFLRMQAYSTGPMGGSNDNMFYRVDVSEQHRDFQQQFKASERQYGAFQILYKPNSDTSLNVKVDTIFQHEHRGVQLLYLKVGSNDQNGFAVPNPYQPGHNINNYYLGLAYPDNPFDSKLYNFNSGGPEEYNDRRMSSATATYEHRINDIFSIREGFNLFIRDYHRLYVDGYQYYIDSGSNPHNGTIGNNNTDSLNPQQPEYDNEPQRNTANQTDLTAKFNTGPVAHQMLLTLDYSGEVDRYQNLRMDPGIASEKNSTGGWVNPVSQLDPNNPNWNFVTFQQNPNLYDQVQENYWDAVNDYGLFLNEHASMFNKRLNVIAGLRFDWLNTKLDDYSVINYPLGTLYEKDFDANTNGFPSHQLGISYRIVKPVTLYINQSTSLNPQPSYNPGTATLLPNSTSTGYEAGAKVDLFKNKLSFTSTYYSINQYNLLYQTTTDITLANGVNETGVDSYVDVLKGHSTGAEFDLSYNPTRSLQVLLDYSYDDASIRQADAQHLFLNGDPIRRVPANQFGSAVHYQFNNGPLKGLFLLCDENFVGRSSVNISGGLIATGTGFVNNPLPNGIFPWSPFGVAPYAPVPPNLTNRLTPIALVNANGLPNTADPYIVRLPDGRESIYNSAYWLTNIGVGYNFKTGKYSHRVQVNVKNLFNRAYTYGSAILGDPITYVCSYTLTF